MVNVKHAADELAKLSLMKFFPPDPQARTALLQMVCGMTQDNARVEWLVRRALTLYNEWPGPRELRALYCSKWKPSDGIEARSTVYLSDESGGGYPRETPPAIPTLTPGKEEARKMLKLAWDRD